MFAMGKYSSSNPEAMALYSALTEALRGSRAVFRAGDWRYPELAAERSK
jgi:hypothetical protein